MEKHSAVKRHLLQLPVDFHLGCRSCYSNPLYALSHGVKTNRKRFVRLLVKYTYIPLAVGTGMKIHLRRLQLFNICALCTQILKSACASVRVLLECDCFCVCVCVRVRVCIHMCECIMPNKCAYICKYI